MNTTDTINLMSQVLQFAAKASTEHNDMASLLAEARGYLVDLANEICPERKRKPADGEQVIFGADEPRATLYTQEEAWDAFVDALEGHKAVLAKRPNQADYDELRLEVEALRASAPRAVVQDTDTGNTKELKPSFIPPGMVYQGVGGAGPQTKALTQVLVEERDKHMRQSAEWQNEVGQLRPRVEKAEAEVEELKNQLKEAIEQNASLNKDREHIQTKYNEAQELLNSRAKQMNQLVEDQVEATIKMRFGATDPAEQLKEVRRLAHELADAREANVQLRKVNEEESKRINALEHDVNEWRSKFESVSATNDPEQLGQVAYVAQRAAVMEHALLLLLRALRPLGETIEGEQIAYHVNNEKPWTDEECHDVEHHVPDITAWALQRIVGPEVMQDRDMFGLVPDGTRSVMRPLSCRWKFDMTFNWRRASS